MFIYPHLDCCKAEVFSDVESWRGVSTDRCMREKERLHAGILKTSKFVFWTQTILCCGWEDDTSHHQETR